MGDPGARDAALRPAGVRETTVDEIAAAAEVSPSTFFRYFKTKEDVVLRDEYDDVLLEAFMREPRDRATVPAMRHAVAMSLGDLDENDWKTLRERTELIMATPALRMRQLDDFADLYRECAGAIATRLGRAADDLECNAAAGAILGVCTAVVFRWIDADGLGDLVGDLDRALAELDKGFAF